MDKSYYAIIPANVRYDKRLTANAKLLYGEITALCNEKGYCWARNSYFAELYGVSKTTISKWINQLIEYKYLFSEIKYRDGSKEIETRYLKIIDISATEDCVPIKEKLKGYKRKVKDPIKEKLKGGIKEKLKDNITCLNTTVNTTVNNNIYEQDFEKLWTLYPNKKGKDKAKTAYIKAIKSGVTFEEIEQGVKNYAEECRVKKIEKQYIRHGSTWFNNKGWQDEYDLKVNTPKQQEEQKPKYIQGVDYF